MDGLPTRAVRWSEYLSWLGQRIAGLGDDGLEEGPVKMETSHHQIETVDPGEAAGVTADVHDPGVSASGQDNSSLPDTFMIRA